MRLEQLCINLDIHARQLKTRLIKLWTKCVTLSPLLHTPTIIVFLIMLFQTLGWRSNSPDGPQTKENDSLSLAQTNIWLEMLLLC